MKAHTVTMALAAMLAMLVLPAGDAQAGPGLKQVFRAATTMEAGVDRCAKTLQGKAFIDCVASELNKFSGRLAVKGAEIVAPQAAPNASTAANGVRAAGSAAAASTVLQRAASVMNNLAASSSDRYGRLAYTRVNQAFSKAATVLAGKS
jgi:hypothetical protein